MSRTLAVIVFLSGVIAAPFVNSIIESIANPALAQEEDLIVIEAAPVTADAYLELVKQKIELLTHEELARETEVLRKELAELRANRKLREAEQQLEQLIDQFPGSAASARANLMLKASLRPTPESAPPFSRNPGQVPTDDDFDSPPRRSDPNRPNVRRSVPNPGDGDVPAELRVEPRDPINKPFDPKKKT